MNFRSTEYPARLKADGARTAGEPPWSHDLPWPVGLKPFDPFDVDIQADPYAHYRWMREHAPVLRAGDPESPLVVVSRHRDVSRGLRDAGVFSSAMGQSEPLPGFILNMDPPEHTSLRSLVAAAFTPRAMQAAEQLVSAIVRRSWAAVLQRGPVDLISGFAGPCTVAVISGVLGAPDAEAEQIREWTRQSNAYLGRILRGAPDAGADGTGYHALLAYLDTALDRAEGEEGETVVANLARLRRDGRISREEACGFAGLLLMAGHETTTILTGNCLEILLDAPTELERLRTASGAKAFLQEMLRYRPPVHRVTRRAAADTEVSGYHVPAGASLRFLVASANRDEEVFADGDRFVPDRPAAGIASFGYGPHMCIGAWLARMEVQLILETIGQSTERLEFDATIGRTALQGGAFATSGLTRLGAKLTRRVGIGDRTSES